MLFLDPPHTPRYRLQKNPDRPVTNGPAQGNLPAVTLLHTRATMKKLLAHAWLRLNGWKDTGVPTPNERKFVLIAAPHTSNWDLAHMLAFATIHDVKLSWLGKHTLFEGAQGWFLKKVGGVPVDRRSPKNLVQQLAEEFQSRDELMLAIPPEGTRKYRDFWKSGFYWIAKEADVPIVLSFLDYGRKQGGFGPHLNPEAGVDETMATIREFYRGMRGKFPDKFSRPYLRDEQAEPPDWPE